MLTKSQWIMVMAVIGLVQAGALVRLAQQRLPAAARFLDAEGLDGRVDLNRATVADLLRTRKIPERLAGDIIRYRNDAGPYQRVDDLRKVKGIGPVRYERIKDHFKVE
jgi:competence protein ComEA